jgi:hypothetical protein
MANDSKRCSNPDCLTSAPVNPKTWPGDEGYCSAICKAWDESKRDDRRLHAELLAMTTCAAFAGYRSGS